MGGLGWHRGHFSIPWFCKLSFHASTQVSSPGPMSRVLQVQIC